MNKETICQDLKNIRTQKQKTQAEMSKETGLSVQKISNIENNKNVSLLDFLIYADALGYTVELKRKPKTTPIIIDVDFSICD